MSEDVKQNVPPTPVNDGVWVLIWRGPRLEWFWEAFPSKEDAIEYYNDSVVYGPSPTYWLAQVSWQWLGVEGHLMFNAEDKFRA